MPRVNVSIKITSLYSQIDPLNFRASAEAVKERLRPIFRKAQATDAFVNLDLEQFRYRDLTLAVFKELLEEEEFASYDQAGLVVQAYLRDAEDDVHGLIEWARERIVRSLCGWSRAPTGTTRPFRRRRRAGRRRSSRTSPTPT